MCCGPPNLEFIIKIKTTKKTYSKNNRTTSFVIDQYLGLDKTLQQHIEDYQNVFDELYKFITEDIGDEIIEEIELYYCSDNDYRKYLDLKKYDFSKLSKLNTVKKLTSANYSIHFFEDYYYSINNLKNLKYFIVNGIDMSSDSPSDYIDYELFDNIKLPLEVIVLNSIQYNYSKKGLCGNKSYKPVSIKVIKSLPPTLKLLIFNDNNSIISNRSLHENYLKKIPSGTKLIINNYTNKKLTETEKQLVNNLTNLDLF